MSVQIPSRQNIHQTEVADPVRYYYRWGVRRFFLKRLKMALDLIGDQKIQNLLEVGCGSGIFFKELSKRCKNLYAVDVHDHMELVKDMIYKERLQARLSRASVLDIPYKDNSFDCVVCVSVLEHVRDLKKAVGEIRRVLKDSGFAVLGFPVENKLTYTALQIAYLWLPGARLEDEHVSTHTDIIREVQNQFIVSKTSHFPALAPLNYSLFYTCRCLKPVNR